MGSPAQGWLGWVVPGPSKPLPLHLVSCAAHEYSEQGSYIFSFPILECIGMFQETSTMQLILQRGFSLILTEVFVPRFRIRIQGNSSTKSAIKTQTDSLNYTLS